MLETKISPPRTAAEPTLNETLRSLVRPIASLQLTVALFAMALVIVFFGTLAQKNSGIWSIVAQYFWSWFVWIDPQLLYEFAQVFFGLPTNVNWRGGFKVPFPAGKLLGLVMFVNLIAAHAVRFQFTKRRAGIFLIHGGLLLMFVNEFVTREFAVEQQMPIVEGESATYTFDSRYCELAIVDSSGPVEKVIAVPASRLVPGRRVDLPDVPFDVRATSYFLNSKLQRLEEGKAPAADKGTGRSVSVEELPVVSGVDTSDNKFDIASSQIQLLKKGSDEILGSYLVSMALNEQPFTLDGKTWDLTLRNVRYYKPYSITLHKFTFERHPGSNIPKEYASKVTLADPGRNVSTDKTISMNEPMRYGGETFYQSGVLPGGRGTILQVVENPGWLLPYVCCGIVSVGLLVHFGMYLREYLRRMLAKRGESRVIVQSRFERRLPWFVLAVIVALTLLGAMPHGKKSHKGLDLDAAGRLPILEEGRVKPLDTAARVALRKLNHKESYTDPNDGSLRPAIDWWFAVATADDEQSAGNRAAMIRIEGDQLLNFFGLTRREGYRYSINELRPKFREFDQAVSAARAKDKRDRDIFDEKVLELNDKLEAWILPNRGGSKVIPPKEGEEWLALSAAGQGDMEAALHALGAKYGVTIRDDKDLREWVLKLNKEEREKAARDFREILQNQTSNEPGVKEWKELLKAYEAGDAAVMNAAIEKLNALYAERLSSGQRTRVWLETFLNDTGLYWWCTLLYVFAAMLTAGAWICYGFNPGLGQAWRKSAIFVLLFTFLLHTLTLLARMYLMDRWFVFVTNLYSTAVFIGWAAVGVSLLVERYFPITLGCFTASVIGFLTCLLAHQLATSGDTIEPMRAVLNTNFWLATHVTSINLGYAATYLAGLVGIIYLVVGIFTPHLTRVIDINGQKQELGRLIGQILYGTIAAATLLSFVGTVLGGIWGDQSWGRFWGWDPKENGALMIVIWNAMILHARWAGLVKDRGIAVLTLAGNMITTWSYFGTNQLGVGLHAYGFSNTLAAVCVVMWCVNLALIGLGLLPKKYWRSYQPT